VRYIKLHWPYMARAPYHGLFGADDISGPARAAHEIEKPHPVYDAFRQHPEAQAFSRDDVRRTVIPTYMGLIKQVDDHVGRLLGFLTQARRVDDTLTVFTSDHGDLLGDHWLAEKELFFEPSVRLPLIVRDPCVQAPRGVVRDDLVEAIDLVPTFLDALGQPIANHVLEGHSLLGVVRGGDAPTREAVFSELDYAFYGARRTLGLGANDARAVMVRMSQFKLVHYDAFPPQLYDLFQAPLELHDRGTDADTHVIGRLDCSPAGVVFGHW
jgi:arylsulfatase A-like enzyme